MDGIEVSARGDEDVRGAIVAVGGEIRGLEYDERGAEGKGGMASNDIANSVVAASSGDVACGQVGGGEGWEMFVAMRADGFYVGVRYEQAGAKREHESLRSEVLSAGGEKVGVGVGVVDSVSSESEVHRGELSDGVVTATLMESVARV